MLERPNPYQTSLLGLPPISVGEHSSSSCGFHALRQFVWWREDSLLAVGVSDGGEGEGDGYREEVVLLSLIVDRGSKLVNVTKR